MLDVIIHIHETDYVKSHVAFYHIVSDDVFKISNHD